MELLPRHQCLIYDGAPSLHLAALAAAARQKLKENYRCLVLNSEPMLAGMRSYLAAAGVDVTQEMAKGTLAFSAERPHLIHGRFEIDAMMQGLGDTLHHALRDGHAGLWATGDMTWEMGPDHDFGKLLEYEWRLDAFFHEHAELSGICQYHARTLPRESMRHGLCVHPSLFINETLSLVNPHYLRSPQFPSAPAQDAELDRAVEVLCGNGECGAI